MNDFTSKLDELLAMILRTAENKNDINRETVGMKKELAAFVARKSVTHHRASEGCANIEEDLQSNTAPESETASSTRQYQAYQEMRDSC